MSFIEQKENPCPHTGMVNIIDPDYTAHPQPVYARILENHRVAKSIAMSSPILYLSFRIFPVSSIAVWEPCGVNVS